MGPMTHSRFRVHVVLDSALLAQLESECRKQDKTVSAIVRSALREHFRMADPE